MRPPKKNKYKVKTGKAASQAGRDATKRGYASGKLKGNVVLKYSPSSSRRAGADRFESFTLKGNAVIKRKK